MQGLSNSELQQYESLSNNQPSSEEEDLLSEAQSLRQQLEQLKQKKMALQQSNNFSNLIKIKTNTQSQEQSLQQEDFQTSQNQQFELIDQMISKEKSLSQHQESYQESNILVEDSQEGKFSSIKKKLDLEYDSIEERDQENDQDQEYIQIQPKIKESS